MMAGLHEEFNTELTTRVKITLKSIQRSQATSRPQKVRLPITSQTMQSINDLLTTLIQQHPSMGSLAFFGFLRVSEFTVPNDTDYDSECHLSIEDIAVGNCD